MEFFKTNKRDLISFFRTQSWWVWYWGRGTRYLAPQSNLTTPSPARSSLWWYVKSHISCLSLRLHLRVVRILNPFKEIDSFTCSDRLFHLSTTRWLKKCFLVSRRTLPNLRLCGHVDNRVAVCLLVTTLLNHLVSSTFSCLLRIFHTWIMSPRSLLASSDSIPTSFNLSS